MEVPSESDTHNKYHAVVGSDIARMRTTLLMRRDVVESYIAEHTKIILAVNARIGGVQRLRRLRTYRVV